VDYANLRPTRPGLFCVALAGCATNVLIATAAIAILMPQGRLVAADSMLSDVLRIVARVNIALGAFNLIPIPPLDGSKILMSVLPADAQRSLAGFQRYGLPILMLLLLTGWLNPLIALMERLIYGLIGLLFNLV
ncbi:MAG: site-2 protease family protein, partial [Candidatus Omnitrophica bacterium]|nr:site-2 protease family protein [Candidatus Omnitrophota bacterium]